MFKKTKIICTLGPGTDKPGTIGRLAAAGMNVARFNFSHGTHLEHAARMAAVRTEAAQYNVALMLDTKGPEMRLGMFAEGEAYLQQGESFILTARDVQGSAAMAQVSYAGLPREVQPGNRILLADGLVALEVTSVVDDDIHTVVLNSGAIGSRKRVAVPGIRINMPFLSEQDTSDLLFGASQHMDFVAASFVQAATDVLAIRKVLETADAGLAIFAKIENAEAVQNIDEIIKVSDGIMVARGDLGIEIPTEEVPLVQKAIVKKCNKAGKPVIIATQMLESMIVNPRPTRAEASDIANAILDGADAIMLSGETASGRYPAEAVDTMARIAIRTEASLEYTGILLGKGILAQRTTTEAISHATVQIAHELGAAAIVTPTETGYTARMVSKYRPSATIIAVTPHSDTARRMQLMWGVQPVVGSSSGNTDEMVHFAVKSVMQTGIVKEGDLLVITAGVPVGTAGTTNMIRVHIVGDILLKGIGIGQKAVSGNVCLATSIRDVQTKFKPGEILVLTSVDDETAAAAVKAAAIIAEEGGLTSQAAILGVSFGIPVIVGVDGAVERLQDGMLVTVDAAQGLVYKGKIHAR